MSAVAVRQIDGAKVIYYGGGTGATSGKYTLKASW